MPQTSKKFKLVYFVIITLLLVGLVPLVLTGWFLSEKSAKELRAVENRYQTQLVQEKARQIEMFGQRYGDLVGSYAKALELSNDLSVLSSPQTEEKLGHDAQRKPEFARVICQTDQRRISVGFSLKSINEEEIETLSSSELIRLENKKIAFRTTAKIAFERRNCFNDCRAGHRQ